MQCHMRNTEQSTEILDRELNCCTFLTGIAGPWASPESFQIRTRYIAIQSALLVLQALEPSVAGYVSAQLEFLHCLQTPATSSELSLGLMQQVGSLMPDSK